MFTINSETITCRKAYAICHGPTNAPTPQAILHRLDRSRSRIRQLACTDNLKYPVELSTVLNGITHRPLWLFKLNSKIILASPLVTGAKIDSELHEILGPDLLIQDLQRLKENLASIQVTFEREFSSYAKTLPVSWEDLTAFQMAELLSLGEWDIPVSLQIRFRETKGIRELFAHVLFQNRQDPATFHLCFNFSFPHKLKGWRMPEEPNLFNLGDICFIDYRKPQDLRLYDTVFELNTP